MAIYDNIKNKAKELLPSRLRQKQSYNSNASVGGTGKGRYQYTRLANRRTHNLSYHEYRNIMKDTQVRIGWAILKYFLMSKNYNLTSNSDDPEDVEITNFIQDCFDNMSIPFREVLKNILTAIPYAYSVQEIVFTVRDGKIVIDALYPVHRKTIDT